MTPSPDLPPLVSVVIPAYNASWCVGKAIHSVLGQDFRDFEIIVVDDGSTDDTATVLSSFGSSIRVVRQANAGLSSARNAGIRHARGAFVAFLDADDWWLPRKLGQQIALMERQPRLGFTSTAARVEDPEGRLVNVWQAPQWQGSFLVHLFEAQGAVAGSGSAVVARTALFDRVGGFDPKLRSVEDIDMWMRLAAVTDYSCVDQPLVVILKRPGSMSRNLQVMRDSVLEVMRKNRHLLPPDLQDAYWRACVASIHGDYAKWRYREGQTAAGLIEIAQLFSLAPVRRGRLGLGLLKDFLLRRPL